MNRQYKKVNLNKKSVVLLDIEKSYRVPYLIEEARKRDWRFFDLIQSNRYIPEGINIVGVITSALPDDPVFDKLRKSNCPIVRLGKLPHPQDQLQPAVLPDVFKAGVMAAEHYASRGFKEVGFMANTPWGNAETLYQGFLEQSKKLGLKMHLGRKSPTVKKELEKEDDAYIKSYRNNELKDWLNSLPKPIGILAYNTPFGYNIDLVCYLLGISVPGEVSILCYNDAPECKMSYTPLSAIDIGLPKIAKQTIHLLENLINGNPPDELRIFVPPVGINLRQSTDILAVQDPAVAKALSFIWENISEPISVYDIAEASGIPLRTLTDSFRKCLNRSLTQEMLRKRLEKACDLLVNTTMPVSDIMKAVGFNSKAYFHKRFQEAFKVTPNKFRSIKLTESFKSK